MSVPIEYLPSEGPVAGDVCTVMYTHEDDRTLNAHSTTYEVGYITHESGANFVHVCIRSEGGILTGTYES